MVTLGREPTRKDIIDSILSGAIPVVDIASLSRPQNLALETIVLSPVIQKFIHGLDIDDFVRKLDVMPLESTEAIITRAFKSYIGDFKLKGGELLRAQQRGQFGDMRRARWTSLYADHFQNDTALLEPIESAYQKIGGETIKTISLHQTGNLSLTQWADEIHAARKVITSIASLRKADSDRTIRPLRQAGELPQYITRRGKGYHINLSQLVSSDSRTAQGCPLNSVDPEGAPDISTSLLLAVHQQFTNIVRRTGELYNR